MREEYALGAGVLALGHAYLAALNMRELARPMMQEVADFAKATISLGENDGQHMVIVEICHGSPTYRLRLDVGQRVPHNTTALGRAYLAAMSAEKREQRVEAICRPSSTDRTRQAARRNPQLSCATSTNRASSTRSATGTRTSLRSACR